MNVVRHKKGHAATSAFSLAEAVIVVFIIGIAAGIAAPRVANAIARQRADATARRLVVDLKLARSRAITTSGTVIVQFHPTSVRYQLGGVPDPDRPDQTYRVDLREAPYNATAMTVSVGNDEAITFNMHGMPEAGGYAVIQVGSEKRTVIVNADTGMASIQSIAVSNGL